MVPALLGGLHRVTYTQQFGGDVIDNVRHGASDCRIAPEQSLAIANQRLRRRCGMAGQECQ